MARCRAPRTRGRGLGEWHAFIIRRFTEAGIEDIKSRTEELAQFIDAASKRYDFSGGADVTISWHRGGRELGEDDIQAAKHWLARESIRRKVAA